MRIDTIFEEDTPMEEEKRFIVLIIYDIVDNKRRLQMVKLLEGYGVRVQKSAFEAYITRKMFNKLVERAPAIIDDVTDSLRIYFLHSYLAVQSWGAGEKHVEDVIIV